jgi:hypothetical protein
MTESLPAGAPALPPDALALLSTLSGHRVEHVLVGELAAAVHGCAPTNDTVAIVPARFGRNLDRLSRALRKLDARWRVPGETATLAVDLSPSNLRGRDLWLLSTELTDLDVDFEPPATLGYSDIFDNARRYALTPSLEVDVAAPEDLVRIAEVREAPADVSALPALRAAAERTPLSVRP